MVKVLTCDICKRPTKAIVGKLLLIPVNGKGYSYSDYEAHADVGICCQHTLSRMIRFRSRKRRPKADKVESVV
jgi:hypothetical protein